MPESPSNVNLGDLVREWYEISQGHPSQQPTVFFRFVAGWIAFNAVYAADGSPGDSDRALLKMYARKPEVRYLHQSLFESNRSYREAVRVLAGGRILDTR